MTVIPTRQRASQSHDLTIPGRSIHPWSPVCSTRLSRSPAKRTTLAECPISSLGYPPLTAETPHVTFRVPTIPAHSSRGPGRRPLTAVTRVRIPYALPNLFPLPESPLSI